MMYTTSSLTLLAFATTALAACPINGAATHLIQNYEKFNSTPYNDGYGFWTIGYGHRCVPNNPSCSDVPHPISEPAAQQLFARDIQKYETCLTNALSVCLNANQYGALVSWTYNEGCGKDRMAGRTIISRLNNGEDPNTVAQQELPKWNKSGGKVSQGLVNRRNAEIRLFQTSTSSSGNCVCGNDGGGGGGGGSYGGYSGGGGSYSGGGYSGGGGSYSGGGSGHSGYSGGGSGGSYSGGGYSGGGSYSGGGYGGYYRKGDAAREQQHSGAEDPAATAPPMSSIEEATTKAAPTTLETVASSPTS